jgi:type II secretory pathway pseudopilin PulG
VTCAQRADNRNRRLRLRMVVNDDRGSIALLLMVILVGVSLGALLVPMIITQDRTTRFDSTRVQALNAAQAGIDVMLSNIRQATTGDGSKLPCPVTPLTGPANLPASSTTNGVAAVYSVTVAYYLSDPTQILPPAVTLPTAIPCSAGGSLTGTAMPSFARLTATGTVPPAVNGSSGGRTLTSTYQFQTDNTAGGLIQLTSAISGTPLCLDAGPGTPPPGYLLKVLPCSTLNPPVPKQVFAYRNDLTVQLVSSVTPANPNGLCVTPTSGGAVSLATCQAPGTIPSFTQQWSYNQYGEYQTSIVTSTVNGVLGTQCINLTSPTTGSQLTLATCRDPILTVTIVDPLQSWTNSRGVGLGAATLPQWTSYSEFSRCIYIPPTSVTSDHLWSYPCTQNPYAIAGALGAVPLGQRFTGPPSAPGAITSGNGTCLASPTAGGWVTAAACSVAVQTGSGSQAWTVNTPPVTAGAPAMPYSTKYTVTNGNGKCLGLGSRVNTDNWSVVQTEPCTGAADQKWNVPANALSLTLQNVEK